MVYITIDKLESAKKLSNLLLEKRLIACCNIVTQEKPVLSLYTWENKMNEDE